ncbi:hypothetical protein sscle_09g072920 [Sclerotinia sclerotiorum 1980 UF-70]|uniref:Membrane anchor Opy2 N-terminal domain-containing protein n=1 Tax=Sclerotinia sclerotiorum (strain ATCC 18683 / 1980 / Ss-1) TaxID=665079 RepID=A0A1D9QCM0_SCLS1|nr:hypothetical protein sscle_09g072920 [Sclerotinia sclerotiorum 1980 UF-70]
MAYYESSFNSLFRRCVECNGDTPACPDCAANEICSLVPPTCSECQQTVCVASSAAPSTTVSSSSSSKSGPNVGAIAGGVIGGVLAVAAVTYLVWRFCIKTKRQQFEQGAWIDNQEQANAEKDFVMRRDARASTHTVGSIASTVLTRASNIIQIAYIPGVTNRSTPSTPGLLVPPVPPIPIALSNSSGTPRYEQEHFFMPGDLRDSTYSGISAIGERNSYARNSVASTIYGKQAIVSPVPAQTVIRGKAAVVSVNKAGGNNGTITPPVPSVDFQKYSENPPSPAFSVGSTFLNAASAATMAKPQVIRVDSSSPKSKYTEPPKVVVASSPLSSRDSTAVTLIEDGTPITPQGPFSDPPEISRKSNATLSAMIQNATRKAQGDVFSDKHEVKE